MLLSYISSMANSKDYISFIILLCVFHLSSHVLTHELSKDGEGSDYATTHWIGYYPNQWGSIPRSPPGSRYSPTRPPRPRGRDHGDLPLPPLPSPSIPPLSNYYARQDGFLLPLHIPLLPMNIPLLPNHIPLMTFPGPEPEESYEGRSVIMRNRKIMKRPSEMNWRSSHAFPVKTSSFMHAYIDGGKN
ncbi:hypothetical protein PIB30_005075 [Stylosanthes scabra]|uniref:Uncharacterized protein n=1 Tax=Stylosanthes scabra TaxID=79078 RepID=A0ABU6Z1Q6_9FABA|nr:hypothetical protein [Stylosanthes scabra]